MKNEIYDLMTSEIEDILNELSEYDPKMFKEEVEDNGGDDDE